MREYFAEKGIEVAGFVQWQQYGGGGSMDEETGLPEVSSNLFRLGSGLGLGRPGCPR